MKSTACTICSRPVALARARYCERCFHLEATIMEWPELAALILLRRLAAPKRAARCIACRELLKTTELIDLGQIADLFWRLEPGDTYPAGGCPKCGAFAYLES